jgi:hypothetical protein
MAEAAAVCERTIVNDDHLRPYCVLGFHVKADFLQARSLAVLLMMMMVPTLTTLSLLFPNGQFFLAVGDLLRL